MQSPVSIVLGEFLLLFPVVAGRSVTTCCVVIMYRCSACCSSCQVFQIDAPPPLCSGTFRTIACGTATDWLILPACLDGVVHLTALHAA